MEKACQQLAALLQWSGSCEAEMPVLSSILFSLGPAPVGRPLLSSGVGLPSSGKCFGNSLKDIPGSVYPEQFLIQVDED